MFQAFGSDPGGPWQGYQALRDVLDPMLVDAAERAGAQVRRGCRAVSLPACPLGASGPDRRVTGVVTTAGTVAAKVVVDAAGRRHWLHRQLGRSIRRVSPPLIAAYGYVPREMGDAPYLRAQSDGWTRTAPISSHASAWTHLTLNRGSRSWGGPPDGLDEARPFTTPKGADVTWRYTEQSAGPGWFVVGDAASVVDPSASHGVLRALMSGAVAARAILDCAAGRTTEERAAAGYTKWIRDWFEHDVTRMHRLYRIFPSWPARL